MWEIVLYGGVLACLQQPVAFATGTLLAISNWLVAERFRHRTKSSARLKAVIMGAIGNYVLLLLVLLVTNLLRQPLWLNERFLGWGYLEIAALVPTTPFIAAVTLRIASIYVGKATEEFAESRERSRNGDAASFSGSEQEKAEDMGGDEEMGPGATH